MFSSSGLRADSHRRTASSTSGADRSSEYDKRQLEFDHMLRSTLKSIPVKFKDKNFSHIAVVAKALKMSRPQDDLADMDEHYESLNDAVSKIVDANYKGFNKSIRNFSDILANLEQSRKWVESLEKEMVTCEDLLVSRADDLSQLYSAYLQHTEFLNILHMVNELRKVPQMLQSAIKEKHYLYSVRQILKYEAMLEREELNEIGALEEIKEDIMERKKSLPDLLVDELNHHCFHYQGSRLSVTGSMRGSTSSMNAVTSVQHRALSSSPLSPSNGSRGKEKSMAMLGDDAADSSKTIERNIRTRVRRMTIRSNSGLPQGGAQNGINSLVLPSATQSDEHQEQQEEPEQLEDDPNMNIQLDQSYFIRTVIEALDELNCLPQAQTRLIQSLRIELRSLIDKHVASFTRRFENSDTAWILQNMGTHARVNEHSSSPMGGTVKQDKTFLRVLLQGQPMMEMIQSLFDKLSNVLRNFRFIISVMKSEKSAQGSESSSDHLDNIRITPDVIGRLRDAIKTRIDELRRQRHPQTVSYINALENVLSNFLDKEEGNHLKGVKVSEISSIFWDMLDTQSMLYPFENVLSRKQYIAETQKDFNNLLLDTLSASDTPHDLTLEHVWLTIQKELQILLQDLLDIRDGNSDQDASQSKSQRPPSLKIEDNSLLSEERSRRRKGSLRFRFGSNIEFSSRTTETQESKGQYSSDAVSVLSNFFMFTPYNLMWLFRPLNTFVDSMGTAVSKMIEADAGNSNGRQAVDKHELTAILRSFLDAAAGRSLPERVSWDYQSQFSYLVPQLDAFHPSGVVDRRPSTFFQRHDAGKPSLLRSTVQIARWLVELLQLSISIPRYEDKFLAVIEKLLGMYFEECRVHFDLAVAEKLVRESLDQSDILPLFQSDPKWKRIYISMLNRHRTIVSNDAIQQGQHDDFVDQSDEMPEALRDLFRELIDDPLMNLVSIKRQSIIDNVPSIILLATLNESLEWLKDQIVVISQWRDVPLARRAEFLRDMFGSTPDRGGVSSGVGGRISWTLSQSGPVDIFDDSDSNNYQHNPLYLLMLLNQYDSAKQAQNEQPNTKKTRRFSIDASGSSRIQFASEKLEGFFRKLSDLSDRCLFALKLDIRVQCFYYLDALKKSVYFCEEEPSEPEPAVKLFNSELTRIEDCISRYLPLEKSRYIFDGISELVSYILVNMLPKMKHRRWNEFGVNKMRKNVYALEQSIVNIVRSPRVQHHFSMVLQYYDLLLLSEKELFAHILSIDTPFTLEQYLAILQTETAWRKIMNKEKALDVLGELFMQRRAAMRAEEGEGEPGEE